MDGAQGACASIPRMTPTLWPDDAQVHALAQGQHGDAFAILGPHRMADGRWLRRAWLPGAQAVAGMARHPSGAPLFAGAFDTDHDPAAPLTVNWDGGHSQDLHDPYRFESQLRETERWLLAEGAHLRPYEALGAHPLDVGGVGGVRFAVWAPNARAVSVVGDFNGWEASRHPMRLHPGAGVWELFVPHAAEGDRYQYAVLGADGQRRLKADPYAFAAELRPGQASVVARLPAGEPVDAARAQRSAPDAAISIYEVHAGSWRHREDGGWLNWDELAATLLPYVAAQGFTHIELLPLHEHPLDASWGYQPTGLYAPTARYGSPAQFKAFVAAAHALGLAVILDWVPAHFPADAFGLALFDGTHLYEHADPRQGFHPDWQTLIYNLGRAEVANFLVGNALYWTERFGVDGLRVDAVASMLYLDYSREQGQWVPNPQGGRENLEAIAFLQRLNATLRHERPGTVVVAEESTAFPGVTHAGGLGFAYKWNMGWMNDVLRHLARDAAHRLWHHDELRFSLMYAWSERFVLPLSHDEVVHGKGTLLTKLPGDGWQRRATLRALLGYMWAHPGKKLLFMGGEWGATREWSEARQLDWDEAAAPPHAGITRLVRDLNRVLSHHPALHRQDTTPEGFAWLRHDDAEASLLAFARQAPGVATVLAICHFTPVVRHGYRLGVPHGGPWRLLFNSDDAVYGGSGVHPGALAAEPVPADGLAHSIVLTVPPLATVYLTHDA